MDRRAAFLRAVDSFVPSTYPEASFRDLVAGRWEPGPNAGTTCAYLPAAALYLAGCRAHELVNHDDPGGGATKFVLGQGVSRIRWGGHAVGAFVLDGPGKEPSEGDIYFISNGPPGTEHVGVFRSIDAEGWHSSDAGQGTHLAQSAQHVTRRITDTREESGGKRQIGGPEPSTGEMRTLVGWVDLDAVPWTADPMGAAAEDPAAADPLADTVSSSPTAPEEEAAAPAPAG
jgi:hypothetical protein